MFVPFDDERIRHHRVVGPLPQYKEERHWIWAAAAVAVALIGTGLSTYAASEQASQTYAANKAAVKQQNQVQDLRAELAQQEAESARQAAAFEERQFRRRTALLLGKNAAINAAAGLDPSSGSPLLTELDNTTQNELQALNIRRGGEVAASAKEFEAKLARQHTSGYFSNQAGLAVAQGGIKAGGTILSSWATYQKTTTDTNSWI